MATLKLRYIGQHQSPHEIDVNDVKAKKMLKGGDYIIVEEASGKIESFKRVKKEDKKDGSNSKRIEVGL